MSDKKPASGRHKTPRQALQIPKDWFLAASDGARAKGQPVSWWIVAAIAEKAEREGVSPLPLLPWQVPPVPPPPAPKSRRKS